MKTIRVLARGSVLVGGVLALALMSGCLRGPGIETDYDTKKHDVRFSGGFHYFNQREFDRSDPESMVRFAVWLSQNDRHEAAADLLSDLADYHSKDSEWEIRCLTAAGIAYIQAGNLEDLDRVAMEIRRHQDRLSALTASPLTLAVLAVSDLKTEEVRPSQLSYYLKDRVNGKEWVAK